MARGDRPISEEAGAAPLRSGAAVCRGRGSGRAGDTGVRPSDVVTAPSETACTHATSRTTAADGASDGGPVPVRPGLP